MLQQNHDKTEVHPCCAQDLLKNWLVQHAFFTWSSWIWKDNVFEEMMLKYYLRKIKRYVQTRKGNREENMLSLFEEELKSINEKMKEVHPSEVPGLFRKIPLDVFGKLLLDVPGQYENIKKYFPSMPSEQVQRNWTGTHGETLLNQTLAFVKTMVYGYAAVTGKKIDQSSILDYGCGWGRIIRLLYKYGSVEDIYGVDPWDESIKICNQNGVKGNLAISDYVPRSLPYDRKFDLIFAFSVFTHLSEKTAAIVLDTLRKYIADDGMLLITIRPKEYWLHHDQGRLSAQMIAVHDQVGYAFTPHNRAPIDGDITYGDTSISLSYFVRQYPQWKIEYVECNDIDPFQVLLFLKPA